MTDEPVDFVPYQVSYSDLVLDEMRVLVNRARDRGSVRKILGLLETIEHRLGVYPQFGEPLRDSAVERAQEWVGIVPPLVVNYIIYEDQRLVCVVKPLRLLRRSGY